MEIKQTPKGKSQSMIQSQRGMSIIEVLTGFGILLMVSLASGAIAQQVLKTSKKSKAAAIGISLESALFEAIDNPEQEGYNLVGQNIRELLRKGTPPDELQLWSSLDIEPVVPNTSTTTPNNTFERKLFYKMKLAPAKANPLFLDQFGKETTDSKWVLRLEATYKKLSGTDPNGFPQYSIAYQIMGNPKTHSLKPFGSFKNENEDFQDDDFVFPISQLIFLQDDKAYTGDSGKCEKVDLDNVISINSIDLDDGKATCVVKGKECDVHQYSVGVELRQIDSKGHIFLDLICKDRMKCVCGGPGREKNWVPVELDPRALFSENEGEVCGRCKYAMQSPIDAKVDLNQGSNEVSQGVCPSKEYSVTNIKCEYETVSTQIAQNSAAAPDLCNGQSNPNGESGNFSGFDSGNGTATCRKDGDSNLCYTWQNNVRIVSAECELTDLVKRNGYNATTKKPN